MVFVLVAGLMIYFTKPSAPKVQQQGPSNQTTEAKTSVNANTATSAIKPVKVEELSCDKKELLAALDLLRKQRDQAIKALTNDGIDIATLSNMVERHIGDYRLVREIKDGQPKSKTIIDPVHKTLREFERNNSRLYEDMIMAGYSGDGDEYIDKFLQGELSPLDPNNSVHKEFILNFMSMGGDKQTVSAIEKLYPSDGPLDFTVAPAIVLSVHDPQLAKQLLSRLEDVNQLPKNNNINFANNSSKPLIQLALQANRFEVAQILLDLGALPNPTVGSSALDYVYKATDDSIPVIQSLLDKGFTHSNPSKAESLANMLKQKDPGLSARLRSSAQQLKLEEATRFSSLPKAFRNVVEDYREQHEPLNKKYLDCIVKERSAKTSIPAYQPINRKKIEQQIDQMVAQKVDYRQIIASLGAINKETVEHGYDYLTRLRHKKLDQGNINNVSKEMRYYVRHLRNEDWDQLIKLLETEQFDQRMGMTPGSTIALMIEKNAPESAIAKMASISNKNDIDLLSQALYQPKLLSKISAYGFNLNATDNSNKNLFYQAVTRNSHEQIDVLIGHGIAFTSDPFGYDPLDALLRRTYVNEKIYKKLSEVGFPITEHHLDYSLYLKTYYPDRYNEVIKAWPDLEVEGVWEPKS